MDRGFDLEEYRARVAAAQVLMDQAGIGALLLMTEPEVRYFTGYLTRFWESPSRPWFLIVPRQGDPVAVIPSIGAALMGQSWIKDIRTWAAPNPRDEGVSLLAEALREYPGPVAVPDGPETVLRMSMADFNRVKDRSGKVFCGDGGIMAELRAVKSESEIAKIRHACGIAARAFDRVEEIAAPGVPLERVCRDFQRLLLEEGADWVPYLAVGAGHMGYADVISPATNAPLQEGDILMLDTGAVWDGYFCDFDRNFALGQVSAACEAGHDRLLKATRAGLCAAVPGARACDVFHAIASIVGGGETAGRLGHGLGMQLTEGVSLAAGDNTVLRPGMVITLEPGVEIAPGQWLVHEENIVIREGGAELLSPWAEDLIRL